MRRALAGILLLLSATSARANDIFVAPAPAGSDSNAGTSASPLRTVTAGVALAKPGDVVHLRQGSYLGGTFTAQGTASAPIRVISEDGQGLAVLENSPEPLHVGAGAAFLSFEDFTVRNSGDHAILIEGAQSISLIGILAHTAGLDGDIILARQSSDILIEGVDASGPGLTSLGTPPTNPCVELVAVTGGVVRNSYIHDGANVLLSARAGSSQILFENDVVGEQGDAGAASPAVALGDLSNAAEIAGAQYEVSTIILRNSIVLDAVNGAVGIADGQHVAIANNLFLNVAGAVISFRSGAGAAHRSDDIQLANNLFVDTTGRMPAPFTASGDPIGTLTAQGDLYWNAGFAIPAIGAGVPPFSEPSAITQDPRVTAPPSGGFADWGSAVIGLEPAIDGPASTAGIDTSQAPFLVVTDIAGAARGARHDRGPYLLTSVLGPDGGAGGSGGSHGAGGSSGAVLPPRDSGCSCRMANASLPFGTILVAAMLLLAALGLRRRG